MGSYKKNEKNRTTSSKKQTIRKMMGKHKKQWREEEKQEQTIDVLGKRYNHGTLSVIYKQQELRRAMFVSWLGL